MTTTTGNPSSSHQLTARGLPERLSIWRERTITGTREISLIRAAAFHEALLADTDEPRAVRLAQGLQLTLDRLPTHIGVDERIVGTLTEKPQGAVLFPEISSGPLYKELDNFTERTQARFSISDEEKRQLRETILPPWLGTSASDEMYQRVKPEAIKALMDMAMVFGLEFSGTAHQGHLDYQRVVGRGYRAIADDARAALAALDPAAADQATRAAFYRSVVMVAEATIAFANRYADQALALAATATPRRAEELRAIGAIARRVPAEPARTFAEAVQSFWFVFLTLMQSDAGCEIPLGRLDQLLYPYYRNDLAAGRLTRDDALELLEELLLKYNDLAFLNEFIALSVVDGNDFRLTMTIGGVDPSGADATNDVSTLLLTAADTVRLTQPNIAVRLHPGTCPEFRALVNQVMTNGSNIVGVFNDEVTVAGFVGAGIDEKAARDYMVTGCVESIPGGGYGAVCAVQLNGPKVVEMALNGGGAFTVFAGEGVTNPIPRADTYPQLWALVADQLRTNIEVAVGALQVIAEISDRLLPNPVMSILIEGCLEGGVDVKSGGARYNLTGVNLIGLGTVADSLAAIDDVVYTRRSHDLAEVIGWCRDDFEGSEAHRQMLLHRTPKFGNGDPRVDRIAAAVVDQAAAELSRHTPYRGGCYGLGLHSEVHHVVQGAAVAATPDGRRLGQSLSPGAGPTSGAAQQGPTAALRSVAGLDLRKVLAGSSVNLRFNPSLLHTPSQLAAFSAMVDTYFRTGGQHLQVNVVDTATLRDAQSHPERYRDLLVRVTGYSARFVDLAPASQEEIIQRVEMGLCP